MSAGRPRLVLLADGRALIGLVDDPEPDLGRAVMLHRPAVLMITPMPMQTAVGQQVIGTIPVLHVLDVPALQIRAEQVSAISVGDGELFEDYLTRVASAPKSRFST